MTHQKWCIVQQFEAGEIEKIYLRIRHITSTEKR